MTSGPPDPSQYDAFAAGYAEHAATAPYNALYERPSTLRLLGDVAGKHVFDAACGPGFYVEELLPAAPASLHATRRR